LNICTIYYFCHCFRWEIQEGGKIEEGDPIATIETDKASMALEYQDEGETAFTLNYYQNILYP